MNYDFLKEIIKLQNLVDEKIILSPEEINQIKSEISDIKNEVSKLNHVLVIALTFVSFIQIIILLHLLKK